MRRWQKHRCFITRFTGLLRSKCTKPSNLYYIFLIFFDRRVCQHLIQKYCIWSAKTRFLSWLRKDLICSGRSQKNLGIDKPFIKLSRAHRQGLESLHPQLASTAVYWSV